MVNDISRIVIDQDQHSLLYFLFYLPYNTAPRHNLHNCHLPSPSTYARPCRLRQCRIVLERSKIRPRPGPSGRVTGLTCSGVRCITENECQNIPSDDGPPYYPRRLDSIEFSTSPQISCTIYDHRDCRDNDILKREVLQTERGISGTEKWWWEFHSLKCRKT